MYPPRNTDLFLSFISFSYNNCFIISLTMDSIRKTLAADLKAALKEKNTNAVKAIRNLMAALDNAGAVFVSSPSVLPMTGKIAGATDGLGSTEVPRKTLTDLEVKVIFAHEIDELHQAIAEIKRHAENKEQLADLIEQVEILAGYMKF